MKTEPSRKITSIRASITFDADHYNLIQQVAHEKRVSVAWVVRDAILKYLRDETRPENARQRGTE
jgi:hypothetical protein